MSVAEERAPQATAGPDAHGKPTEGAGMSRRRRVLGAALLALPAVLLAERVWDRRWMTDDGFINLRVVRMILDGHGPVFNAGERVEVTTSPLWVWILALGDVVLPLRLEWVAVVLGLVGAVAGLALATWGAARLHRLAGSAGPLVPAGAAVVAVVPPVWDFSTSGLEGGLTFGWLGLSGYLLARWAVRDDRRLGAAAAVVVGLGPLVRPDLALVSVPMIAGVLLAQWRDDRLVDRARFLACAAAVPVAYQIFRMGYFASLVPNTGLAKAGGRSRWGGGFAYLRDLVQPYWLVVPLAVLLAAVLVPAVARALASGRRRLAVALAALPVGGLLHGVYIVRVGGDYMHGRLLLPALFALLVPVAAVPLPGLPAPGHRLRPWRGAPRARDALAGATVAVVLVWAVVCLVALRRTGPPVADLFVSDARQGHEAAHGEHAVTAADQGWGPDRPQSRLDPTVEVYVNGSPVEADPPPELPTPASAGFGIGISGYVYGTDVYIIDMLGLGDPVTGRFELARPGPIGHEKPMPPAWLAARISTGPVERDALPDTAVGPPLWVSRPGRFDADTEAARAALDCGEVRELTEAVGARLTPGRFLSNLVSAPRHTLLSVPPEPEAARRRFCG